MKNEPNGPNVERETSNKVCALSLDVQRSKLDGSLIAKRLALFLAGLDVEDLEVFDVVDRVCAEGETCAVGFFDAEE